MFVFVGILRFYLSPAQISRTRGYNTLTLSLSLSLSLTHSVHSHYYGNIYSMVSSITPLKAHKIANTRLYPEIFTQKFKITLNLIEKMLLVAENKYRIKFDFFFLCLFHSILSHKPTHSISSNPCSLSYYDIFTIESHFGLLFFCFTSLTN